jgi:hypothetical protein
VKTPGIRRAFTAKHPPRLAEVRARLVNKQNNVPGVPASSVSRLERGFNVSTKTAEAYCKALNGAGASISLKDDFTLAKVNRSYYSWAQVMKGAEVVGRKLFKEFSANVVLTFPGPSGVFANLAMAAVLTKEQIVRMPVLTAYLAANDTATPPSYKAIDAKRFKIFVPSALLQPHVGFKRKIAIIDDSLTTGRSLQVLRGYLSSIGYTSARVRSACCVCFSGATVVRGEEPEIAKFKSDTPNYRMPWGPAFSFESCFASDLVGYKKRASGSRRVSKASASSTI